MWNAKHPCRNAMSFLKCFPYVCPKPVLVKRAFLYINGAQRRVALPAISFPPLSSPSPAENALPLSFSDVCPEPVLVKKIGFSIKRLNSKGGFRTTQEARQLVALHVLIQQRQKISRPKNLHLCLRRWWQQGLDEIPALDGKPPVSRDNRQQQAVAARSQIPRSIRQVPEIKCSS
jgi:hypothetical protein